MGFQQPPLAALCLLGVLGEYWATGTWDAREEKLVLAPV